MPSHPAFAAPRRVPQQPRGQRRVFTLLGAASEVLAEKGYEAATMSEIADRAHAAIGSLYQFFPNKESIACALQTHCGQDLEKLWTELLTPAKAANLDKTLGRLIEVTLHYIDTHPVVVALQKAPNCTWNASGRMRLEQRISNFFLASKPSLSRAHANLYATVCMQIVKNCCEQYLEADSPRRKRVIAEYKTVLYCYANARLNQKKSAQ